MLFVGLLLLAYSVCLLVCLGSPAPGGSPAHNELDPLTLIISQESTAQALHRQSGGNISFFVFVTFVLFIIYVFHIMSPHVSESHPSPFPTK